MVPDFKNYTISNAKNADIERFKAYIGRTTDKKTYQAFTLLLDLAEAQTGQPQDELNSKYQAALKKIDEFNAYFAEQPDFAIQIESLTNQLSEAEKERMQAEEQLKQLKAYQLETSAKKPEKQTAFEFEPSPEQYQQMRRVIAYLIKNGKLNRSSGDLPQALTQRALAYYIKNEFNHII